jgi:threonine/homoserine/homoserine lactone efflux protein
MTPLFVGFGLGLFVGAQPGPVSLLCVRSVLRGAFTTGVAIGAGAALIDLLYAGLGLAGAASLLEIDALRVALGALGAAVLAFIGGRTPWPPSASGWAARPPSRSQPRGGPSPPRWQRPPPTRSRSPPGRRSSPPRPPPRWAAPAAPPRPRPCCWRASPAGR